MLNRYEQVVLTYTRQWQFWAYLAGWVAVVIVADAVPPWFRQTWGFVFLSIAATGPAGAIGQAKSQIADARGSLVPGFRTPHVVVAFVWSLATMVLLPLLSHGAFQTPPLGMIASVAAAATAFALLAYFQSVWAVVIGMGGAGLMILDPVREVGFAMMTGQRNGMALMVLAVSTLVFAMIFYRLAILREGMGEYSRILSDNGYFGWGEPRGAARQQTLPLTIKWIDRMQLAAADQRLRAIRNVFGATPWRRVRHWMLAAADGSKWIAAVLLAIFLTALPLFFGGGDEEASVAIGAVMSVLLPVFCVTATWMSRRRSMGYELTRPVSRERFVREFGLAMATDLAEWWVWLTAAALVPVLVWGPPLRVPDVLAMIVLSAAEQVLAFGILATLLRLRSPSASDGSIMTSIIVVVAPIMVTTSIPRTPALTLAIASGVAALGTVLTYDAYRRWCEMDLA